MRENIIRQWPSFRAMAARRLMPDHNGARHGGSPIQRCSNRSQRKSPAAWEGRIELRQLQPSACFLHGGGPKRVGDGSGL